MRFQRKKIYTSSILVVFSFFPISQFGEKPFDGEKVTFCAVGDILLDRGIRTLIRKHGVQYPFEETAELINSYDLAFCNLECPLSQRGSPLNKTYTFRGDSVYVDGLHFSGFTVFSLANNHTLDYGQDALADTRRILEKNGLSAVGADSTQALASKATIIQREGLTLAFLASVTIPLEVSPDAKNVARPAQTDIDRMTQQITKLRNNVDFIIVSFHWGTEFSSDPTEKQRDLAHRAIDSGADVVLGHHPHVIQGIEKYKGRCICYSLGNFIFDQHKLRRRESIVFGCTFSNKTITSPHIVPIFLEGFRPHLAQGDTYERILNRVRSLSMDYGVKFRDNGKAIFLE
jgi:poly-gamma-glutamate synthesis protein (capsule biosynthesis protein)